MLYRVCGSGCWWFGCEDTGLAQVVGLLDDVYQWQPGCGWQPAPSAWISGSHSLKSPWITCLDSPWCQPSTRACPAGIGCTPYAAASAWLWRPPVRIACMQGAVHLLHRCGGGRHLQACPSCICCRLCATSTAWLWHSPWSVLQDVLSFLLDQSSSGSSPGLLSPATTSWTTTIHPPSRC